MRLYLSMLILLAFVAIKVSAQKHDVTHFINWLIDSKGLTDYDIIQFKQPTIETSLLDFLQEHKIPITDSQEVKKQLQKPLGRLKPKKIKGATILSNAAMTALQKEFHAKHQVPGPIAPCPAPYFYPTTGYGLNQKFSVVICAGAAVLLYLKKPETLTN